jgi:hypothetical protein
MDTKHCFGCKKDKSLDCFHARNRNKSTGRVGWCKECSKAYRKKHYILNKEKCNRIAKEYWKENKTRLNEWTRNFYWSKKTKEQYEAYVLRNKKKQIYKDSFPKEFNFCQFSWDLYGVQKRSCRERADELPKYTLSELREWLFSQKTFPQMVRRWIQSKFSRSVKPTLDRINPFETYSFDNIQLMTVGENCNKGRYDMKTVYGYAKELYKKNPTIRNELRKKFLCAKL